MCGCVEDGIIPGLVRLRGRPVLRRRPLLLVRRAGAARRRTTTKPVPAGIDIHALLQEKAARQGVGESGLLALDWWNGNRSILVDAALSGLLVGATLATTPEEVYRALIEATAYGTRVIVETFEANGVPDPRHRRVRRSRREEPADPPDLRRRDRAPVPRSAPRTRRRPSGRPCSGPSPPAPRPADTPRSRTPPSRWPGCGTRSTAPIPANRAVYDVLYREYLRLHDYFGRGENDVMKTLRAPARPRALRARRRGGLTMRLEVAARAARRAARRAAAQRAGRLDRRQRQRARPRDGARRDQAVRRPLCRPDRRIDGRGRPRRADRRRGVPAVLGHVEPPVHLPPPPRRQRHRPHAFPLRHGLRRGRPADPRLPDRPGRRVRWRDPMRRLRLHRRRRHRRARRRGDRTLARPSCSAITACSRSGRTAWPRSRRPSWSRTSPRPSGPPSRSGPRNACPDEAVDRLHHRYTSAYGQQPRESGGVPPCATSVPTRFGSSPAASTSTARRRIETVAGTRRRSRPPSMRRRRSPCASWPDRS